MGAKSSITAAAGKYVAPRLPALAPELNASFVREALHRAIHGIGPLPLGRRDGREGSCARPRAATKRAVRAVIDDHVRYAGAQGMLTSVGGAFTAMVTIPTNITGLALIQARMVSVIAHLRGYDLEDPRVRNAILACMLGEDKVDALVEARKLPAPPMAIATAPVHDPEIERVLCAEVTSELVTKVAGKHAGDRGRAPGAGRRRHRRHGRRRLRDVPDRALRRRRAAPARPAVGRQRPAADAAVLQPAHGPLAPAVRRAQVGPLQRPVGLVAARPAARPRGGAAGRPRAAAP